MDQELISAVGQENRSTPGPEFQLRPAPAWPSASYGEKVDSCQGSKFKPNTQSTIKEATQTGVNGNLYDPIQPGMSHIGQGLPISCQLHGRRKSSDLLQPTPAGSAHHPAVQPGLEVESRRRPCKYRSRSNQQLFRAGLHLTHL